MIAGSESSAGQLHTLIVDVATPVVKRVVRRRFQSARDVTAEDQEDVCADALAAIIARLQAPGPIDDLEAYAAGVAAHIASRFFMSRSPRRAQLRNRLRYVLSTNPAFRIRQSDHGAWLCEVVGKRAPAGELPGLAHSILTAAPEPLELSELTTLAAGRLGVTDRLELVDDHLEKLFTPGQGAAHAMEARQSLEALWGEVCLLPAAQRIALLLNLKGAAWLIPDLGIASFRELAAKLEMTPEELAAIWNRLPLADKEIAARLKLARQQVINLRSSARQRLTRRMPI